MQTRHSTRSYIETMYRSGGEFQYDMVRTHQGSHKYKLNGIENRSKDLISEMNCHKNNLMLLKTQSENMKREFNENYQRLKGDINDEIDDFQMKLSMEMNKQKKKHVEINKEMNELKNDIVKSKNLLCELKDRVKALQLRVNGE